MTGLRTRYCFFGGNYLVMRPNDIFVMTQIMLTLSLNIKSLLHDSDNVIEY